MLHFFIFIIVCNLSINQGMKQIEWILLHILIETQLTAIVKNYCKYQFFKKKQLWNFIVIKDFSKTTVEKNCNLTSNDIHLNSSHLGNKFLDSNGPQPIKFT